MALRPWGSGQAQDKHGTVSRMPCGMSQRGQHRGVSTKWDMGDAIEVHRCRQEANPDSLQLLEVTQEAEQTRAWLACSWSGAEPALERQAHKAD